MKINIIPTIITLLVAALCAYLFYSLSSAEEQMIKALAISGFVTIVMCLECGIGITFEDSHHAVNTFVTTLFFLIVFIIEHICFALWGTNIAWLIVTSGLLSVVYLLIYYSISKAKM